jgi:hypothetical protein
MANLEISYTFKFGDRREEIVQLVIDPRTIEMVNRPDQDLPGWTRLEYEQCPHCPLASGEVPNCPVAVSLIEVVRRFEGVMSYDRVDLEVVTAERKITQNIDAQKAISSLVGLLISTSGCPHAGYFKPMARYHLPLASVEETVFRATGMYLLAQFFLNKTGKSVDCDLQGLTRIYHNMHLLNISVAERLRSATGTDSSINAVIILDIFTQTVNFVVEDHLREIRHLFEPYLGEFYETIRHETSGS